MFDSLSPNLCAFFCPFHLDIEIYEIVLAVARVVSNVFGLVTLERN